MGKLILTDVDETVLKFAEPFQDWMVAEKGFRPIHRLRDHYSVELVFGVTALEARQLMAEFSDTEIMLNQPPEPCALAVLPKLYAEGYRFVAITACGTDPDFQAKRRRTLEQTFGFPWEAVHVVELRGSKRDFLKAYDPAVWVEDHYEHAVDGAALGHDTYLIHRDYNWENDHPEVTRVSDWWELHDLLDAK